MDYTTPDIHNQSSVAFRLVRFNSVPPCTYTMHEHFELFYVKKGTVVLTVDDVTATLCQGDLSLIAPYVFHKNEPAPDAIVETMHIAPYICNDAAQVFGDKQPLRPYLRSKELPFLVREILRSVSEILAQMQDPQTEPEACRTTYQFNQNQCGCFHAYLSVLLLELSRNMPLSEGNKGNTTTMQKILKYCAANFGQEITRRSVSRDCNVSVGMISLTFNRLGTSFRDYINTMRISRAYQLLTTTKKPITEIIYECGYSNQGTFNRNFQLQFGKSPRDVRHGK